MAYMSQDRKKELAPMIRTWCKVNGIKASIAVRNHSTLVVNIKSGKLDFCQNYFDTASESRPVTAQKPEYMQVNTYWAHEHFTGDCRKFLVDLIKLMNRGNHDNSDIMTDYFDVGWYVDVNVGSWNKPYVLEA
jgi:hypothetical protein